MKIKDLLQFVNLINILVCFFYFYISLITRTETIQDQKEMFEKWEFLFIPWYTFMIFRYGIFDKLHCREHP